MPRPVLKNGTGSVIRKIRFVSRHDRAGHLIDTREFINLKLPANRFSGELLEEFLEKSALTTRTDNGNVLFSLVYVERRVRPLNLYIRYVGVHDVFPEEFIRFLSMDKYLQSLFLEVHADLLSAGYWRKIQARHLAGEASVVVPYFRPALPRKPVRSIQPVS